MLDKWICTCSMNYAIYSDSEFGTDVDKLVAAASTMAGFQQTKPDGDQTKLNTHDEPNFMLCFD
jgi:hypothetical protein